MNYNKLRSEWKERIEEYQKSGLSKSKWCRENGYKLHQLLYWIKKNNQNENQAQEINWIPIPVNHEMVEMNEEKCITIKIGKCNIKVEPGFNGNHLKDVVKVLSEL
ncbi:IS66 family insertion sequence element accessory protein TnpB [Mycoplasmatota bacterium]|nr:IS66 family insertion sequence element accessory protein TnpB [Mycoplasmatota bacterium]QVK18151.1 IS66 family insertion sequence element accessory protein TnpB [Mycoplasmatota bacterium]QVK18639.1 IS66 family insertion sequence element accessory protein TnpB [Mycoplasmatota bacterium]